MAIGEERRAKSGEASVFVAPILVSTLINQLMIQHAVSPMPQIELADSELKLA